MALSTWRARPFVIDHKPVTPGQVVYRSVSNHLVIQSGSGFVLIDDRETSGRPVETGTILASADFRARHQVIIDRHNARYPDNPVAKLSAPLRNEIGPTPAFRT